MDLTAEGRILKSLITIKVQEVLEQFPDVNPREVGGLFSAISDLETSRKILMWRAQEASRMENDEKLRVPNSRA